MTTLSQMVDQVLAEMQGYVRVQDSITTITGAIDASVLTIPVEDATALAKGIVEIEDELLYVKKVNQSPTNTAEVITGGRGWATSTAATHASGKIIRNNPTFSRVQTARAINETITTMNLYGILSHSFTFDGSTYVYPLPVGAEDVTGVTAETLDSSGRWAVVQHWRLDRNYWAPAAVVPSLGLELLESPSPGRLVRVQYLAQGQAITSAQEFSVSGLPSTAEDCVRMGAMWRLVSTLDPAKLTATSPSAEMMDQTTPAGKPSDVSRYLYQLFNARLNEEKSRQADQLSTVIHHQ